MIKKNLIHLIFMLLFCITSYSNDEFNKFIKMCDPKHINEYDRKLEIFVRDAQYEKMLEIDEGFDEYIADTILNNKTDPVLVQRLTKAQIAALTKILSTKDLEKYFEEKVNNLNITYLEFTSDNKLTAKEQTALFIKYARVSGIEGSLLNEFTKKDDWKSVITISQIAFIPQFSYLTKFALRSLQISICGNKYSLKDNLTLKEELENDLKRILETEIQYSKAKESDVKIIQDVSEKNINRIYNILDCLRKE